MKKNIFAMTLAALAMTCAQAETVEGLLEKGPVYSAIFSMSPGSGDLVGQAFKNQSVAGKLILNNCMEGMVCKVENAKTKSMDNTDELKFSEHPSGWKEFTQAKQAQVSSNVGDYDQKVKTRHGVVSIDQDDYTLQFKGKQIVPTLEGSIGMSIVSSFEVGKNDVLLVQNPGGTACPAQYTLVTISPSGATGTPEFGTCTDLIYAMSDAKDVITVDMIGFKGQSEPVAEIKKAARTKYSFKFANGVLTANGKPVK